MPQKKTPTKQNGTPKRRGRPKKSTERINQHEQISAHDRADSPPRPHVEERATVSTISDSVLQAIQAAMATQMATQMQGLRTEFMEKIDARIGNLELQPKDRRSILNDNQDMIRCDSDHQTTVNVLSPPHPADHVGQPVAAARPAAAHQPLPAYVVQHLPPALDQTPAPTPSTSAGMRFRDSYSDADPTAGTYSHFQPAAYTDPEHDTESAKAINELLIAAGSALGRKRGKHHFLPHLYIIRGEKNEKVGLGEATWAEYFGALLRMGKDPAVPQAWKDPILEHMHQLTTMALTWDWSTCRLWSEKVFSMISDGRLPHGWAGQIAIKNTQTDVCLIGTRADLTAQKKQYTQRGTNHNTQATNYSQDGKPEYSKEVEGKPCHPWNWGNECGFTASHGQLPDRKAHICAWCANKYHRVNLHQEKVCINKKRFTERKAAPSTDTQASAGF